jgi:hypothetical protein
MRLICLSPGAVYFGITNDYKQVWHHPQTQRTVIRQGADYECFEMGECGDPGCMGCDPQAAGLTDDLQLALDWCCGVQELDPVSRAH